MSLAKVKLMDVVKRQYQYKLKAYSQVLVSLMILQLIAVVFSFNGTGMSGSSSDVLDMNVHYYSANIVVVFTILWGFITAIFSTTKGYRYDDLVFITNRLTSNLSNTIFLLTASVVGGITSMLSTYLIKVMMYYFMNSTFVEGMQAGTSFVELLLGIFTTSLYIFLFCGFGYLVGTLVQISKLFVVLLPALVVGSVILAGVRGKSESIATVFQFYFTEHSVMIFMVKVIISVFLLFSFAFILSNRMEVKQR